MEPDTIEPGDLLFFATQGASASHVGMAIGGDEFVHAPSSRGEVRVERLSAPYWAARFVGARRMRSRIALGCLALALVRANGSCAIP